MAIDDVHLYYDKNLSHAAPLCFAKGDGKWPSYGRMDSRKESVTCEQCKILMQQKDAAP
jgi:hypothetical protein